MMLLPAQHLRLHFIMIGWRPSLSRASNHQQTTLRVFASADIKSAGLSIVALLLYTQVLINHKGTQCDDAQPLVTRCLLASAISHYSLDLTGQRSQRRQRDRFGAGYRQPAPDYFRRRWNKLLDVSRNRPKTRPDQASRAQIARIDEALCAIHSTLTACDCHHGPVSTEVQQ